MAKTYQEKLNELRLKSLRIIEDSLTGGDQFTRFIYATQFLSQQSMDSLKSE